MGASRRMFSRRRAFSAGQAALLYPSDAHAPGLADGELAPVKKIVVKIALER